MEIRITDKTKTLEYPGGAIMALTINNTKPGYIYLTGKYILYSVVVSPHDGIYTLGIEAKLNGLDYEPLAAAVTRSGSEAELAVVNFAPLYAGYPIRIKLTTLETSDQTCYCYPYFKDIQ
jgi:hypothetical protein